MIILLFVTMKCCLNDSQIQLLWIGLVSSLMILTIVALITESKYFLHGNYQGKLIIATNCLALLFLSISIWSLVLNYFFKKVKNKLTADQIHKFKMRQCKRFGVISIIFISSMITSYICFFKGFPHISTSFIAILSYSESVIAMIFSWTMIIYWIIYGSYLLLRMLFKEVVACCCEDCFIGQSLKQNIVDDIIKPDYNTTSSKENSVVIDIEKI